MDADAFRRRARVAVVGAIAGPVAATVITLGGSSIGSFAAEPTPDPSPTAPSPVPAPTNVDPPEASPFDGVVGGDDLGQVGEPLVSADAPPLPEVDGFAWLVADVDSGEVLAAFSPHEHRAPASTIKLLTAITASPRLEGTESYTADTGPESIVGSRAGIVAGGTYTVDDLMNGLILQSGNDAAHALAELLGGQDTALDLMNERADELGAFDTEARTPHGLDTPEQTSSAYDLALIGREALADETVAEVARAPEYNFPDRDGGTFQIQNQNRLLGAYEGAVGLKTGYTTQAGHTFVGAVDRDDRRLIATVLAADGRAEETAATLFDWAYEATATEAIEPVGHLVTPDEVEQAQTGGEDDDADADGGAGGTAGGGADGAHGAGGDDAVSAVPNDAAGGPVVMWSALAAVLAGALLAALIKRRRPPVGRYAAYRRAGSRPASNRPARNRASGGRRAAGRRAGFK